MPDEEYIFRQAKRIYDDCVASQNQGTIAVDASGLVEAYNDLLARAQDEFPANDVIQSLDEAQTSARMQHNAAAVQRVRSRVSQLADALDIDLSDLEDPQGDELRPINLTVSQEADLDQQQAQTQAQQQQQYVDVDSILEDVDRAAMPPDEKEALKELIREFEAELEGERDVGGLRQLLQRAQEYAHDFGVDVTAKLGILALQYGVTELVTG